MRITNHVATATSTSATPAAALMGNHRGRVALTSWCRFDQPRAGIGEHVLDLETGIADVADPRLRVFLQAAADEPLDAAPAFA